VLFGKQMKTIEGQPSACLAAHRRLLATVEEAALK